MTAPPQQGQAGTAARGMQLDELLRLPVMVDLETSNRAFLLGRTKGFSLAKQGNYPCQVTRVGRTYRVSRAALLRALDIDPTESGAGSSHPTPPCENDLHHQR